jgi:hypothetical protein
MAGTFVTAGASARKIQRRSALCTLYAIIRKAALLPIIRNDDFVIVTVNTRMPLLTITRTMTSLLMNC